MDGNLFFLDLMIINESMPNDRTYAPKAVYIDPSKPMMDVRVPTTMLPQQLQPMQPPPQQAMAALPAPTTAVPVPAMNSGNDDNGYHKVSYPHYLSSSTKSV